MIVSHQDIRFIEEKNEEHRRLFRESLDSGEFYDERTQIQLCLWGIKHYHNNPHLLLPVGFDEVRFVYGKSAFISLLRQPRLNPNFVIGDQFALFRWESSGVWYWLHEAPYMGNEFRFIKLSDPSEGLEIPFNHVITTLRRMIDKPDARVCQVVSPLLWTPSQRLEEAIRLRQLARDIINSLRDGRRSLSDIGWADLECVVAELLHDQGLEVHRVVERPQGGKGSHCAWRPPWRRANLHGR